MLLHFPDLTKNPIHPSGLPAAAEGRWSGVPPITPTTAIFWSRIRKLPKASMITGRYVKRPDIPRKPCRVSTFTDCVYVAETDEQAHKLAATYLPDCWKWGENKYDSIPKLGHFDYGTETTRESYQKMFRGMGTGLDFSLDNNLAYVGSPENCNSADQGSAEAQRVQCPWRKVPLRGNVR